MGYFEAISFIFRIAWQLLQLWREAKKKKDLSNAEQLKRKKEEITNAIKGIISNDRTAVTMALGRLRRM